MRCGDSAALFAALLLSGCGNSGLQSAPKPASIGFTNGPVLVPLSGSNVLPLTVNGSLCSAANSEGYPNKPCVSVTICDPSQTYCTTIDDVLLDTGSYGLRVFGSVIEQQNPSLAAALTPISGGGSPVAECARYADSSADWGPVETASVTLGGETPVSVPIQIIDSGFADSSQYCSGADSSPEDAGYNAILGVGLFAQDCGSDCAVGNGMYFTCSGSSCTSFAPSLSQQVTNPVSLLPADNNGVIVELPYVVPGGEVSTDGYLVLGIGTQDDNTPVNINAFSADPTYGEFSTTFDGSTYPDSFVDSGSNGLYFAPPSSDTGDLPSCGSDASAFYCPSSTNLYSADTTSSNGQNSAAVFFQVGNTIDLLNSGNSVFAELAGNVGDGGLSFDWGLPFFYGRDVFVGIEGSSSSLGTGPYWAY